MGRRSKDPEIRRMEMILAAEGLFREKGFEATSVSDITDKVGVSHGAFFYYFDSKNEILKAVIGHYVKLSEELVLGIVKDKNSNALIKIQTILDASLASTKEPEHEDKLMGYMHREGNEALHSEYVKRSYEMIIPLITEVVEEGIKEGYFDVKYPKETVEYIVNLFDESLHQLRDAEQSKDTYYRKIRALEIILTRVFGMKEGSISLLT
jgi:AcrR family transcriptional regulator